MTEQDYNHLELLLGKLSLELKHRYCIIPQHINDGVLIGIYGESGVLLKEANHVDIKSAVEKLKEDDKN
jgi:hypothetical protein